MVCMGAFPVLIQASGPCVIWLVFSLLAKLSELKSEWFSCFPFVVGAGCSVLFVGPLLRCPCPNVFVQLCCSVQYLLGL